MGNLGMDIRERVSNKGAVFMHLPTKFSDEELQGLSSEESDNIRKMNDAVDELKRGAVTMDFGANSSKEDIVNACSAIIGKCKENSEAQQFLNLDNVLKEGVSKHPELVERLLKDRTLPTGEKLPDNAVLLMVADDKEFDDPEVSDNVMNNSEGLQSCFGNVVELPKVPSMEQVNDFRETLADFQSQKGMAERALGE